uniref:Uncharacterized protein n=1 Tax=Arundo donax TaxID=35708 RepID=A0A0A9BWW5_ARUDO
MQSLYRCTWADSIFKSSHVHSGRDVTVLDPVPSFMVNFYWTVKTSDGTHQFVHNLY